MFEKSKYTVNFFTHFKLFFSFKSDSRQSKSQRDNVSSNEIAIKQSTLFLSYYNVFKLIICNSGIRFHLKGSDCDSM